MNINFKKSQITLLMMIPLKTTIYLLKFKVSNSIIHLKQNFFSMTKGSTNESDLNQPNRKDLEARYSCLATMGREHLMFFSIVIIVTINISYNLENDLESA